MQNTALIYIENNGKYLMIYRTKKEKDANKDKWLGIGGRLEEGESPFDCARREAKEETGLTLTDLRYRGIVTFVSDKHGTEYMHLFHSASFAGELNTNCNEGELEWIDKRDVISLPIWEGDKIFLDLLDKEVPFFSLKLIYRGDKLIDHVLE